MEERGLIKLASRWQYFNKRPLYSEPKFTSWRWNVRKSLSYWWRSIFRRNCVPPPTLHATWCLAKVFLSRRANKLPTGILHQLSWWRAQTRSKTLRSPFQPRLYFCEELSAGNPSDSALAQLSRCASLAWRFPHHILWWLQSVCWPPSRNRIARHRELGYNHYVCSPKN